MMPIRQIQNLLWQIYKKFIKHLHINIFKLANMLQTKTFQVTQSRRCKAFDSYYGNRRKLGGFQSHAICMNNEFNPNSNLDGFVNFGTSTNGIIAKTTNKYLPQFMKIQDCGYPDPRGYDQQFNKVVCEGTKFAWDETFTFNNVESILSLLCYKHKKVFVFGKNDKIHFDMILDHSKSQIVAQENADIVIFFEHSKQLVESVEQKSPKSVKLFILSSKQELNKFDHIKNNCAFAYQFALKQGLNFAGLHTKEPKIKKQIEEEWFFFSTSTITRRASLVPDLKIQIGETGTEAVRKMIEIYSKVIVPQQNIWFTLGVATGIDTISRTLFQNVKLGVDAPYYFGFNIYFTHNRAKIVSKPILPDSRIVDRIKQSERQGCSGYIICNPKNPVGTIMQPEQVDQICQYVRNKPNFHLIFDEAFVNTCFVTETKSAASYAVQLPNVHVARGLGKDFGVYGFKVGFTISSNPLVMKKFKEWKPMISHHPYTISVANSLLKKSNYGNEIFETGKKILRDNFEIACSELDKQKISYEKPVAGCFVYLNLKEFMRQQTLDEEFVLWKKLFYKYRVNVSNGASFHNPQYGYFRICPIFDQQIMKEGLQRLISSLKDKSEQ